MTLFCCCKKVFTRSEYMKFWEKVDETLLTEKGFYRNINVEIPLIQILYTKSKTVTLKKLTEYHDLYVQGDKLSLADVFDNFPVMCLVSEIFFFWSMCLFLFSYSMHHGQHASSLKKTKVKVDPLNDVFNGTKRYYKMNSSRKSSTWNITIKIKNQHIIW